MDTQAIVDILNELLAFEQRNMVPRVLESTVFISRLSIEAMNVVQEMARTSAENGAGLADAIRELGGVVGLRTTDTSSADLHYQELHHVLPRLLADREALLHRYELAAHRVGAEPRAVEAVQSILRRHQEELARLQQIADRNVGAAR